MNALDSLKAPGPGLDAVVAAIGRAILAGALALALAGCTTPQSPQLVAAKTGYGFELAYSTAADAYNGNLVQLATHGNQAKAKALMLSLLYCDAGGRCTGYVQLARDAVAVGNAADVTTQTAAISAIAAQVIGLINASK